MLSSFSVSLRGVAMVCTLLSQAVCPLILAFQAQWTTPPSRYGWCFPFISSLFPLSHDLLLAFSLCRFIYFYFMGVSVLYTCRYLYHMCAKCLQRPEKGITSFGTGVADGCLVDSGNWIRSSARTAHAFNLQGTSLALLCPFFSHCPSSHLGMSLLM